MKDAQDVNHASQEMSIAVKQECMGMLSEFKKRIDDVDRVKTEVERL